MPLCTDLLTPFLTLVFGPKEDWSIPHVFKARNSYINLWKTFILSLLSLLVLVPLFIYVTVIIINGRKWPNIFDMTFIIYGIINTLLIIAFKFFTMTLIDVIRIYFCLKEPWFDRFGQVIRL